MNTKDTFEDIWQSEIKDAVASLESKRQKAYCRRFWKAFTGVVFAWAVTVVILQIISWLYAALIGIALIGVGVEMMDRQRCCGHCRSITRLTVVINKNPK